MALLRTTTIYFIIAVLGTSMCLATDAAKEKGTTAASSPGSSSVTAVPTTVVQSSTNASVVAGNETAGHTAQSDAPLTTQTTTAKPEEDTTPDIGLNNTVAASSKPSEGSSGYLISPKGFVFAMMDVAVVSWFLNM